MNNVIHTTHSNTVFNYAEAHSTIESAPQIFGAQPEAHSEYQLEIRYTGIRAQIVKAFNYHLAKRSQGSTLDTWERDFMAAKRLDNMRKSEGIKSSTAYKKYSDLHWAFRNTVKEAVVEAMKRKEVGKSGLLLAIPHLDKLHKLIGETRARLSDLVYGAEPAVPFWECYTLIGHSASKEPEFQKSEIWDGEQFKAYCGTRKFIRDSVKWAVSSAIQKDTAPKLLVTEDGVGTKFWEVLYKGVDARMKQDVEDGKAEWDRHEFFTGGVISGFKEKMHVETCLAMVGRVVKTYNNVVGAISYDLGRMLNTPVKAGSEMADYNTREVYGYELTVSLDTNTGEVYINEDREFKALTNEIDCLTEEVERYLAAWEKILPRKYLIAMGTDFNGGYRFNEENGKFSKIEYKLVDISTYFDADRFAEQKERRKAYAIKAEMARLKELEENAGPMVLA